MTYSVLSGLTKATVALFIAGTATAHAETWTLDGETSRLAFAPVKNDVVGEVHSFESLSGTVAEDGTVKVAIDLSSLQTNIDIRNERMAEHVFKGEAEAVINAKIDMAEFEALEVGETTTLYVEGTVDLLGNEVWTDMDVFVARLADDRVLVTTNDMIMLGTEDAGVDEGVNMLQQLAELGGITRVAPVTLRFVFDADTKQASLAQ